MQSTKSAARFNALLSIVWKPDLYRLVEYWIIAIHVSISYMIPLTEYVTSPYLGIFLEAIENTETTSKHPLLF